MRVALIALEDGDERNIRLEGSHALALATRMRDGGRLAPLLIATAGSDLAQKSGDLKIPLLEMKRSFDAIAMFKLWRWQKKHKGLLILGIGSGSIALGCRLWGMRPKNSAELDFCFFLKPPAEQKKFPKNFFKASHFLCGSSFISEKLRELAGGEPAFPEIIPAPPGINVENYDFSRPVYTREDFLHKRHFVFGMAESLEPRSGALLVARAMAALWQKYDLPRWEVRMFGSGPRFNEVLEEAQNLGVASRLSLLAEQPLGEVARYCHAWLAPGSSPMESPQDLWCAFAARIPLICSKSDLHKERLAMGAPNAALTVDGNNPQEMARAMIAVAANTALRNRLVEHGAGFLPVISLSAMSARICDYLEEWGDKAGFAGKEKEREGAAG